MHSDELQLIGAPALFQAWHKPLVSIIVTHYNYSRAIDDAIGAIVHQTHDRWECIIVDDGSAAEHVDCLKRILEDHNSRFRLIALEENVGQIAAFYEGLRYARGHFICPLDPDDRYAPNFLEEALAAHLNEAVVAPVLSTDQYLITDRGMVAAACRAHLKIPQWTPAGNGFEVPRETSQLYFYPAHADGWFWGTTSSLMFRRPALELLRPHRRPAVPWALDPYLVQGAHMLGGSLFYAKPLVYRMLHERNSSITNKVFSSFQDLINANSADVAVQMKSFAREVLEHNKAPLNQITQRATWALSRTHRPESEAAPARARRSPAPHIQAKLQMLQRPKKRSLAAKWRRSIMKRLPFKRA